MKTYNGQPVTKKETEKIINYYSNENKNPDPNKIPSEITELVDGKSITALISYLTLDTKILHHRKMALSPLPFPSLGSYIRKYEHTK